MTTIKREIAIMSKGMPEKVEGKAGGVKTI